MVKRTSSGATGARRAYPIPSAAAARVAAAAIAHAVRSRFFRCWTIGAGMEYALSNNLSVKGEYLYVGLSDTRYLMTDIADGAPMSSVKDHNDFSTVRVGLNYRFGGF